MVNNKQTRAKAVLWNTRKVGKNGSRMRQTALMYLHVTARLQLTNCFKPYFTWTYFQHTISTSILLRAAKYNFNILQILVNSQIQCSHLIQTQAQKSMMGCKEILMPFTKEAASLYAKPGKPKLHLSAQSSLRCETRHLDALTHNFYFCAYSGLQNTLKIH